ncbi:hypothetical protein GCM10010222_76660 [Streptomyces tanashiensis]|nr:hypothetical protein GCM10010222_76660 [Streptomyces tanashiensis]
MEVPALRDPRPCDGPLRVAVALDDRHLLGVLGEYPSGKQSSETSPDDHRVTCRAVPQVVGHTRPFVSWNYN